MLPYVQRHEFEGLLFSDVRAFSATGIATSRVIRSLARIRSSFETPEDINDKWDTAPSRRIEKIIPQYSKLVHGPRVAEDIGLGRIRENCPRFHNWLLGLESLQRRNGAGEL